MDIRRLNDRTDQESGVSGPAEVIVDMEGDALNNGEGCCRGVSVEVETLVFFIDERVGGGGRLCCFRSCCVGCGSWVP